MKISFPRAHRRPGGPTRGLSGWLAAGRRLTPVQALVVCALTASLVGAGTAFASTPKPVPLTERALATTHIPSAYLPYVRKAANRCVAVTAPLVAAMADANARWVPRSSDPYGAKGLGRFVSATWEQFAVDGDGDGDMDPLSAADALVAQADYVCWIDQYLRRNKLTKNRLDMTLAAYKNGPGTVRRLGRVPSSEPAGNYIADVRRALSRYTAGGVESVEPGVVGGIGNVAVCQIDNGGCVWVGDTPPDDPPGKVYTFSVQGNIPAVP